MKLISNNFVMDLSNTQVMGILNVAPDSFFDGGRYCTIPKAIDHVHHMISSGATLIDIGGESTRPGSQKITESEECDRVLPVLNEVVKRFDVFISINTSSALIMREATVMGVHLINDVRSLQSEESMQAAKQSNLSICLTHIANSKSKKCSIVSDNIINEIDEYFAKQIIRCELQGIPKTRLLIDPGFGFGKSIKHNYQLLINLKHLHHFKIPVLVGISRKSMVNYNQYSSPYQKLIGSVACAVIAAMQGIQIIRVHDVKETMEALQIVKAILKFNNKEYGNFI